MQPLYRCGVAFKNCTATIDFSFFSKLFLVEFRISKLLKTEVEKLVKQSAVSQLNTIPDIVSSREFLQIKIVVK